MAVTSAHAVNLLVDLLKASPLTTAALPISGKVYAFQRPLNSQKEDVVVNSLTLDRQPVQKGMLNVNIYTPNLQLQNRAGEIDTSRPNMVRLTYLSQLASDFLNDIWQQAGTVNYELQQETILADKDNQHYINFRVIFRALNV